MNENEKVVWGDPVKRKEALLVRLTGWQPRNWEGIEAHEERASDLTLPEVPADSDTRGWQVYETDEIRARLACQRQLEEFRATEVQLEMARMTAYQERDEALLIAEPYEKSSWLEIVALVVFASVIFWIIYLIIHWAGVP